MQFPRFLTENVEPISPILSHENHEIGTIKNGPNFEGDKILKVVTFKIWTIFNCSNSGIYGIYGILKK